MTLQTPLEITFRNLDHSDAVEAKVREKVEKLEQIFDRITSCRVRIEAINRQHTKGNLYQVHIEVGVPGKQVMVDHRKTPRESMVATIRSQQRPGSGNLTPRVAPNGRRRR